LIKLKKRLSEMIAKADGQHLVTVADAKRSCRVKACDRTVLDKLHKRNIYMRNMRETPVLTQQDIADRFEFAKEYKCKLIGLVMSICTSIVSSSKFV
jgi:hypothetical protein